MLIVMKESIDGLSNRSVFEVAEVGPRLLLPLLPVRLGWVEVEVGLEGEVVAVFLFVELELSQYQILSYG